MLQRSPHRLAETLRQPFVASAFLERFITDPSPLLNAPGTGAPWKLPRNDRVIAISTNFGQVGEDLLNRGLPIALECKVDIASRKSKIGNPRYEFLPKNEARIAAEFRGMIARWREAGCPLDEEARHPCSAWAKTVGGILKVAGFTDFLANYSLSKMLVDPVREAIGILGAAAASEAESRPERRGWMTPGELAQLAAKFSLKKVLIPPADRDTEKGQERGIGRTLTKLKGETFQAETETERLKLRLEKGRHRFGGQGRNYYTFVVEERQPLDEES